MLKAVIIGSGGIGSAYDAKNKRAGILTHAHAYRACPGVRLEGFYDTDDKKAKRAARAWGANAFSSVKEMMQGGPDIVSVCVPDDQHEKVMRQIIPYKPKAIFCEKPLTSRGKDSESIRALCEQKKILLVVNYTRRWCSEIIQLKADIAARRYGRPLNAVCVYAKGIRHTGSHAIDLLRFFFGPVVLGRALARREDWSKDDPTLDAFLKMKNGPNVHLVASDTRCYSVFELDLLFEKKRILLLCSGRKIRFFDVRNHRLYPGFKILSTGFIEKKTDLTQALAKAVVNMVEALQGRGTLQTDARDAVEVQKICEGLIAKIGNREK